MKAFFFGAGVGLVFAVGYIIGYYRGMKDGTKMGKKALSELAALCAESTKESLQKQHEQFLQLLK